MPTFIWEVSNNTKGRTTFKPIRAQFEGFAQVAGDGRNAPARTVNIEVGPMESAEAIACHNFLDAQYGLPFTWTPPKPMPQVASLWTCEDFSFQRDGGLIIGVTAVFVIFNSA